MCRRTLSLIPLFLGAGTVGIVHMAAPDHWLTLSILGKSKDWSRSKIFRTSLVTAVGHVILSLTLGVGVAAVGIVFSTLISTYLDISIGIILIFVGLFVGIRPLLTRNQSHHPHEHDRHQEHPHQHSDKRLASNVGYFAVLGAALSPDPSIAPIFLAAVPAGYYFLIELAIVFAITSIAALVLLVQLGNMGFAKVLQRIPEKYNDSIIGLVIAAIGVFILLVR